MKLSISWIFDHINANWKKQNIDELISKFNKISAEIENYYKIDFDLKDFALGKITKINNRLKIEIPEWKIKCDLPSREDFKENLIFMVRRREKKIEWAKLSDFGLDKDGYVPALDIQQQDLKGEWKKYFETQDVIIEVDNKSITHRPDMWGHRGFAREIAAFLNLDFIDANKLVQTKSVDTYQKKAKATEQNPISIEVKAENACKRFAGIYFNSVQNKPTNIFIFSRLIKVGVRPINGLIDLTNYLTLDWSQPVHVYDVENIEGRSIIVRMAEKGEKITLLDENEIKLSEKDLVIADENKPLCLAGVMGGIDSIIQQNTKNIFFESANFDAAVVRRTALRHKCRTESSIRFEKTLDPNQNIHGILRFLRLAKLYGIELNSANRILSVGIPIEEKTIQVEHEYFQKRSGLKLDDDYDIIYPLQRLGFKVEKKLIEDIQKQIGDLQLTRNYIYTITIPTFRSCKDVQTKEDILEEIVRFFGLDKIALSLPCFKKQPSVLNRIFKQRKIKNYLVECAKMIEQRNYAFFDENFLESVKLQNIESAAEIVNPVSQNAKRLVSSLLPGLFKNIQDNFHEQDRLRFFEMAKIWSTGGLKERSGIKEIKKIAGVFFEKRKNVDFYQCKAYITGMLSLVGINTDILNFVKIDKPKNAWCIKYQSAYIYYDKVKLGILGKVDPLFLSKLDVLSESDAFFFELNADFLIDYVSKVKKFDGLPKYQETYFDLSMFVPLDLTTKKIESILDKVDVLVIKVKLIDFFEKEDWLDKRSLTFRIWLNSEKKTLEKDEIDAVWKKSIKSVEKVGASLR
ncbi:phenylalanine--tRNA ligase subunit beta [Candidatus Dependentiae bacterium]|nr:phenylalanine--tRNA ligase subunit beta [Candidatus Dependentiae bacterium]